MSWLGLDVGGANLKLADGRGLTVSRPFPLWKQPERLAAAIAELLAEAPAASGLAITMTGELADCFATKREGVQAILEAVEASATASFVRTVCVYLTTGRFVDPLAARAEPLLAAASNWHALARFAGRFAPSGSALLIDIGSTTSDIIPLVDGRPTARGTTDLARLATGELVYTGVQRSPVCAVASEFPSPRARSGNATSPVAQELFATTRDAYLMLGDLPEDPDCTDTADGRPATRTAARDRLARMICADREQFTVDDALAAAEHIAAAQLESLTRAGERVIAAMPSAPQTVIVSGAGEFLARRLALCVAGAARQVSLAEKIGLGPSRCAPAHALAVLASEAFSKSDTLRPKGRTTEISRRAGFSPSKTSSAGLSPSDFPMTLPLRVIKLGGSLLELPDLPGRLRAWFALQPPARNLIIVGGGPMVDQLRVLDRVHRLGEEACHVLAMRLMTITAQMLHAMLPDWPLVPLARISGALANEDHTVISILDPIDLPHAEVASDAIELPNTWDVTSDSLAAQVARITKAGQFVLLKSTLPPQGATNAQTAADSGYVDSFFPRAAAGQQVRCVNLRDAEFREQELAT